MVIENNISSSFFLSLFFNRIFEHFVNFNIAKGQILLSGADSVMKRQEEVDRMESGRTMIFYRKLEEKEHERFKTLNRGV